MPVIRVTPVVRVIILLNVAFFLVQSIFDTFFGTHLFQIFSLVPHAIISKFEIWRIFTYAFLHTDLFHLLFNLLVVWMVGSELEDSWGAEFFVKFSLTCGLAGAILYLAFQSISSNTVALYSPMVGFSGVVYGYLTAYGILFSDRVMLFMMIFPMKAKYFVLVLGAVEFLSTVLYSNSRVANIAHLAGMAAGFIFLWVTAWWRMREKEKKDPTFRRKKKKKHLRLVVNNEVYKEFDTDEDTDSDPESPTFH
jgi:membrane associated rhomboid family serine protease